MINLHHIDCMEFMKNKPDKYYDLAIVDPPYGIGEDGQKNHSRGSVQNSNKCKGSKNTKGAGVPATLFDIKNWDNAIPDESYFKELFRVSKNQIIWGGNFFLEHLQNTPCFIVWDKKNGTTDFADCELAWTSFRTAVRKFEYMWNGMLQGDMKNKESRIHPTQKPIALYKWILSHYAKPGNRILDTHGGSMSIAIACHDMGFDLDLCEIDKDYFEAGKARIDSHMKQSNIFDVGVKRNEPEQGTIF